ncbi:Alpha-amylase A type-3 [Ancistrocladus abbreviatus]
MSSLALEPLLRPHNIRQINPKLQTKQGKIKPFSLDISSKPIEFGRKFHTLRPRRLFSVSASSAAITSPATKTSESSEIIYSESFPLKIKEKVEGKIFIRLDQGKNEDNWLLTVGCSLPGKWVLHWGVNYLGDVGSEWDQPPAKMRPPGSIAIKDYAIETPLKKLAAAEGGYCLHEVKIDFDCNCGIAAINFALKDEETGKWYQHRGRDFKVPLVDYLRYGGNVVGSKKGFGLWAGALGQLSNIFLKTEAPQPTSEDGDKVSAKMESNKPLEGFYEEQSIVKEVIVENLVSVSVRKCQETAKTLVYLETDLPGDVVLHWGVCRNNSQTWEIPEGPYPPDTEVFKNKALCTRLQRKEDGSGVKGLFALAEELDGFIFVLKWNDDTWLKCRENDFFIPLSSSRDLLAQPGESEAEPKGTNISPGLKSDFETAETMTEDDEEVSHTSYTDGIISEIRNLVSDISSFKNWKTKGKDAQESILREIEKLAAEAYSIFRGSSPTFTEEVTLEAEVVSKTEAAEPSVKIISGTGSGFEILCQGFNWESHKSGRWYMELHEKAEYLSSLGFTIIWLPPPTESVSPEGYLPKDLYNLNSRYGTVDELKTVVKRFHDVGIKVLGDVVLNHRCAHYQNQNGIWNIFGGRLNWDDRAVVADDPHFQGRGSKSSGDNFHAAPNIDHSQDFVRKDIKEWLCWLREDIGYDGWRLDFVRGFWGGYVKDYLESSEPYFAVGEYWDSLSYTYSEMNYDQDAHRQRIIDWINAAGGKAGAFDVTTKGILHSVLDRCEYWRLSDAKGKPPGVLGWWPSRAVTFIENHDTGSTQGHWRFPGGKEMQGYAYILTHPGTPAVFYDHIFSNYQSEIGSLVSFRKRKKIHCRSTVKITKAERDVYAAIVDEKVAVKIGPGYYEPTNGPQKWSCVIEGKDYKVWEAL